MAHKEESVEVEEVGSSPTTRTRIEDVDNYHGLTIRTVVVYLSLCLIVMSQLLNLVAAGTLVREISKVIGGADKTSWLSNVIAILTCILGPPVSQAADYFGRKWFIVILTVCGGIGCIIVGRASSMGMAIAGELIAGLAFGCQALLYAVASEILPRRYRPYAQGGINVAVAFGAITAILAGFALVENNPAGFRTYFEIIAGLQFLSALSCLFLYNPAPRSLQVSLTLREKLHRLDWVGYGLLAVGIALFSVALTWSENPYSWSDAHILAPFIIGVICIILFVVHQTMLKKDGMFHHDLFKKDQNYAIGLFGIFAEGLVFFAANYYLTFEFSILYEPNLFMAGVRMCITFFSAMFFSVLVSLYCSKTKKLRIPTTIAYIFLTIFNILMATTTLENGRAVWCYPIFLGAGLGICLTCIVTAAQLSAPPALISISTGLLMSVRSLGGSIGVPIYNAIYTGTLSTALPREIAAAVLPLGLSPAHLPAFIAALVADDVPALEHMSGVTPRMIAAGALGLKTAYLEAFRYIWVCSGCFAAIAAVAMLFLANPKNDFTMHVDAPLEGERKFETSNVSREG